MQEQYSLVMNLSFFVACTFENVGDAVSKYFKQCPLEEWE